MDYSFIVPVYNCLPYLQACVGSIREIGLSSWEVILVDDGSTDGSGLLCDRLTDDHIRAVHQANQGVSAARNTGIREAKGRKILFVDSDDTVDSELYRRILEDPRCRESDLTVFGMSFDYYYHGNCYRQDMLTCDRETVLTKPCWGQALQSLFACNALSPVWNKVYSRKLLMENEIFFDEALFLYEDLEFSLRYLGCCNAVFTVPEAAYHYRQAEDEGNAGRRLRRIPEIPGLLQPMQQALEQLQQKNQAISSQTVGEILGALHQVLAREKIAVSNLEETRKICDSYRNWAEQTGISRENSFHRDLMRGKARKLRFQSRKSALRHWLAVRIKAMKGKNEL